MCVVCIVFCVVVFVGCVWLGVGVGVWVVVV